MRRNDTREERNCTIIHVIIYPVIDIPFQNFVPIMKTKFSKIT